MTRKLYFSVLRCTKRIVIKRQVKFKFRIPNLEPFHIICASDVSIFAAGVKQWFSNCVLGNSSIPKKLIKRLQLVLHYQPSPEIQGHRTVLRVFEIGLSFLQALGYQGKPRFQQARQWLPGTKTDPKMTQYHLQWGRIPWWLCQCENGLINVGSLRKLPFLTLMLLWCSNNGSKIFLPLFN